MSIFTKVQALSCILYAIRTRPFLYKALGDAHASVRGD